jgi:hypothetical protein
MPSVVLSNPRDVREFVEAKRRKREPITWHAQGVTEATCKPRTLQNFAELRSGLRCAPDFARASERLDALERALRNRHALSMPKPRKITQNSDCSLTLWWRGAMVRCFADGFVSFIGGAKGVAAKMITPELLDVLAAQTRIVV